MLCHMPIEHQNIFQLGVVYRATRDISVGFKMGAVVPAGTKLKYVETKYSRYDGCYVYYFQRSSSEDVIEFWVREEMPIGEIQALLPRCA